MEDSLKLLSDVTHYMKYARYQDALGRRETFQESVSRNMMMHIERFPKLTHEIMWAYEYVFSRKVLPSMRSMQFAGLPILLNNSRIFNCAFVPIDDWRAFSEVMFLLLGGTGVGFSVQSKHVNQLPPVKFPDRKRKYVIGDSIEGWADAVRALVRAYLDPDKKTMPIFDYRDIRPKGARLITSGGKAPGPEPLKDCLHNITKVFERKKPGEKLTPLEVYDIVTYIADAVLAGGIRRSALIALFDFDDEEMFTSKYGNWWELNPQRARSNNSAVLYRPEVTYEQFRYLWERNRESQNGEPGVFLTNDPDGNYGFNPCVEASLYKHTFCNLTEINTANLESEEDFFNRARAAAIIGTLQASYTDFHYLRQEWKENTERDALLGVSLTGIAAGTVLKYNLRRAAEIVKETNAEIAAKIGIRPAARTTLVKPSGTASLILGTSSGIHAWHAKYYIRRLRIGKNEAIYDYLINKVPELIEDDFLRPEKDAVLSIPVKAPEGAITREESAIDLLNRVKFVYENWILPGHRSGINTHNVSATITVKEHEWDDVINWLWHNRNYYAGITVLPYDTSAYKQAPFEEITEAQYKEMLQYVKEIDLSEVREEEDNTNLTGEVACAGGACEVEM